MWRQAFKFGLVGALATLVHVLAGAILIATGWHPLAANALAFATAFLLSFIGHLGYSFADQEPDFVGGVWKFGLVALGGFTCNETLLAALLKAEVLPDPAALVTSTAVAAMLTFGLSRVWVFKRKAD